jgi:hypothetical protein
MHLPSPPTHRVRAGANVYLAPIFVNASLLNLTYTFFGNLTPVYQPLLWADRYATAR